VIVRLEACSESPEAGKNVFAGKATFALKFESLLNKKQPLIF